MSSEDVSEEVRPVDLFGSAAVAALPARMRDVSAFLPVPDHQELYTDAACDQSVMFEILVSLCLLRRSQKLRQLVDGSNH